MAKRLGSARGSGRATLAAQPLKTLALYALMTAVTLLAVAALLLVARPFLLQSLEPQLVQWISVTLSERERRALLDRAAAEIGYMWDAAPEPLVARLGKRDIALERRRAEVRLNNAGLRSSVPFGPKREDRFRIVCLGDSIVFGEAGREQDRFCDQIQAFYRERGIRAGGREIETYALGLTSWTALQEATYLTSRLTAYRPDVILVLSVGNDIGDNAGVTGGGVTTYAFSPERRAWGSATFHERAGIEFGNERLSALVTGLGPESRERWRRAMGALGRLVELQRRAGGHTLLSISRQEAPFPERYKGFLAAAGIEAPLLLTDYFPEDSRNRLPHDTHPNRAGHSILASHYIHALDALGWLETPDGQLPPLDPRLSLALRHPPDAARVRAVNGEYIERCLRRALAFGRLEPIETSAFLGGILPAGEGDGGAEPWASVRAGWLMRAPPAGGSLELRIAVPPRIELFPFELRVRVNGEPAGSLALADVSAAGLVDLRVPAGALPEDERVLEVLLETDAYFTEIVDPRMRSYRLVSARVDESEPTNASSSRWKRSGSSR